MACLDTSILIDLMDARPSPTRQRARTIIHELKTAQEQLFTTRINLAELYVGIERASDAFQEERRMTRALASIEVLELDERGARVYGQLQADLLDRGLPCGEMDVLIAAIALTNRQRVVTRNARHFAPIRGLTVVSY